MNDWYRISICVCHDRVSLIHWDDPMVGSLSHTPIEYGGFPLQDRAQPNDFAGTGIKTLRIP